MSSTWPSSSDSAASSALTCSGATRCGCRWAGGREGPGGVTGAAASRAPPTRAPSHVTPHLAPPPFRRPQIILYGLFGHNMIAFAFLLSCFFSSSKTATIFAYLVVFGTGLIGSLLLSRLIADDVWYMGLLELIPSFALFRCGGGGARVFFWRFGIPPALHAARHARLRACLAAAAAAAARAPAPSPAGRRHLSAPTSPRHPPGACLSLASMPSWPSTGTPLACPSARCWTQGTA
jgi:hypothetical protein